MQSLEDPAVKIDEPRTATDKTGTVSQRKLNANRQNAKKSTGPRTSRGKAYSRKNAIKHGLFTGIDSDFALLGEFREEYDQLLNDLHKQFDPIGRAEELEVERIRGCWWKFQRVWRYENSENHRSVFREVGELEQLEKSCRKREEEVEAIVLGLQKMIDELLDAAEVPPDLKDRFFVLTLKNEQGWKLFEEIAEGILKKTDSDPVVTACLSTPECRRSLAISTLRVARAAYEEERRSTPLKMKFTLSPHIIPNGDALDKILRYDTTIDRSLDRALNRLERLQRRRKGEPVLPPVNVQLT